MTNLALVTAGSMHIVESRIQLTLPLGESLAVGDAVRIDTNGKWTGSNASTTTENRIYGILASVDPAGAVGTAIRKGVVDGLALTALAYDAIVYLSDTDKKFADAAGTVSTIVGRVIPGTATTTGTAYDKLLFIDL